MAAEVSNNCEQCGHPISLHAGDGLCPICALDVGNPCAITVLVGSEVEWLQERFETLLGAETSLGPKQDEEPSAVVYLVVMPGESNLERVIEQAVAHLDLPTDIRYYLYDPMDPSNQVPGHVEAKLWDCRLLMLGVVEHENAHAVV